MDSLLKELEKGNRENLPQAVRKLRKDLMRLRGEKRLDATFSLAKWAESNISQRLAEDVLDDVIEVAKNSYSEVAALILAHKAYYRFLDFEIPNAENYVNLALSRSRAIESDEAETKALVLKGYLCDGRKEYKKSSAWYTIALAKCTRSQEPNLLLDLSKSLSNQGDYRQAWSIINKAISLALGPSFDRSLESDVTSDQDKFLAKAYSGLASVLEGIGDFSEAISYYDKALAHSLSCGFFHELYDIYSLKLKFLIMLEDYDRVESLITQTEKVFNENNEVEPRVLFLFKNDWARLYKVRKNYEEALIKYKEMLFDKLSDDSLGFKFLNSIMDNQANVFSEILLGIAECLYSDGRIRDSEIVYSEEAKFSDLKQKAVIESEIDRSTELDMQKKRIRSILRRVLLNESDIVEYKNILAKYSHVEDKTFFKIGKSEIKRSRRYFLVFKCLVHYAGKCVSGKMLDNYVREQGESLSEYDSGLRSYVGRLKKDIKLAQFFDRCTASEGKGWKLKAP